MTDFAKVLATKNGTLVGSMDFCEMIPTTYKTFAYARVNGRIPRPIDPNAKRLKWRKADVLYWIEAGMPPQNEFDQLLAARNKPVADHLVSVD